MGKALTNLVWPHSLEQKVGPETSTDPFQPEFSFDWLYETKLHSNVTNTRLDSNTVNHQCCPALQTEGIYFHQVGSLLTPLGTLPFHYKGCARAMFVRSNASSVEFGNSCSFLPTRASLFQSFSKFPVELCLAGRNNTSSIFLHVVSSAANLSIQPYSQTVLGSQLQYETYCWGWQQLHSRYSVQQQLGFLLPQQASGPWADQQALAASKQTSTHTPSVHGLNLRSDHLAMGYAAAASSPLSTIDVSPVWTAEWLTTLALSGTVNRTGSC